MTFEVAVTCQNVRSNVKKLKLKQVTWSAKNARTKKKRNQNEMEKKIIINKENLQKQARLGVHMYWCKVRCKI